MAMFRRRFASSNGRMTQRKLNGNSYCRIPAAFAFRKITELG